MFYQRTSLRLCSVLSQRNMSLVRKHVFPADPYYFVSYISVLYDFIICAPKIKRKKKIMWPIIFISFLLFLLSLNISLSLSHTLLSFSYYIYHLTAIHVPECHPIMTTIWTKHYTIGSKVNAKVWWYIITVCVANVRERERERKGKGKWIRFIL